MAERALGNGGGRTLALCILLAVLAGGCVATSATRSPDDLRAQVMSAERAFARTMADRDHAAFTEFLAEEAIFFSGEVPLRGRAEVAAAWEPFFDGAEAPFSWEPVTVEVLDSGTLAFSTGPVFDPVGRIVGRFNSIWRREGPDLWRVIFDKGSTVCDAEAPEGASRPSDETGARRGMQTPRLVACSVAASSPADPCPRCFLPPRSVELHRVYGSSR